MLQFIHIQQPLVVLTSVALQAAQEVEAARAPKAAKKGPHAKPAASAVAAAAGAPGRPASAKAKLGAPAKKTIQSSRDDEDVPLAQRIAAAKRKQAAKAQASGWVFATAEEPLSHRLTRYCCTRIMP